MDLLKDVKDLHKQIIDLKKREEWFVVKINCMTSKFKEMEDRFTLKMEEWKMKEDWNALEIEEVEAKNEELRLKIEEMEAKNV
ncbi:hypothetical protein RHGRI_005049 [Rhododendron griersonianum]|uniref:Uncharacterized protein n=1 Tax=Rhododendron griersonianum TaxID=479676 RepID=A0AAV6LB56_9ERIC|nr:hypothetical protein RHGRI_005049 [Rhododendron griersonianum]